MRRDHLIVGREGELARLRRLLDPDGPSAVVVDGEAGIGKTTLWQRAVDAASDRRVLAARPAEGEASLPFAALGDLLEQVPEREEDGAGAVVLETARRRGASAEPASRLAVARETLELVRRTAERTPLLLALDDVQWLDPPSAEVLEFVLRRLGDGDVRVLVSRRTDAELPAPLGLDRPELPAGVDHLRVRALEADEIGAILLDRLDLRLTRPRLAELHRACAGNPFYALEIGRALLDRDELPDEHEPLPVPDRGSLLARRLAALGPGGRQAALLAAAVLQPSADLVERAARGPAGIEEAIDAGVLALDGSRLRFAHPLLASAAYGAAAPWERRDAHERLAQAAGDPLERAHHLARATLDPDEDVAAELAAAATEAAGRGAQALAARLLQRAAQLTPARDEERRRRRLLDSVPYHLASGDPSRGKEILEGIVEEVPRGTERAEILLQIAELGNAHDGIAISQDALAESAGDASIAARAHILLATFTSLTGDRAQAAEHARTAASLAKEAGDDRILALAVGDYCYRQMIRALPYPREELEQALEIERSLPPGALVAHQRPSFQLGVILAYTDHPDEARPLLRAELARLESVGDESWLIGVLFRLAELELRAGNWAEANAVARRCAAAARHAGIAQEETVALVALASVQAHVGELDAATESAEAAIRLALETGDRSYTQRARAVLGFVELSRGDPEAALAHLRPAGEDIRKVGMGELSIGQVVQNEIEALVAVGRLEDAEEVIGYVEEKGRPTRRAWHEAIAARGRALVAAARGDADGARRHVARALAAHERLPQPFELGRTLLAQGSIERRAKRRGESRAALTQALGVFDGLGAPFWAEKAADELARIPGRAPAGGDLSETERQIAELVATGLSNKEIASRLFVTVRTVEGNLTRIYGKLGVRSRTELASRLAREADS